MGKSQAILAAVEAAKPFDEWPDPLSVEQELPPVEVLPVELIPEPYRAWCHDIAYRMQCPLDFVAVGSLVSTAAVIGTGCAIRPKQFDDWQVIPNLWGGIVGNPSMLKTPSLSEVMKPLARLEMDARKVHEESAKQYQLDMLVHDAEKKKQTS